MGVVEDPLELPVEEEEVKEDPTSSSEEQEEFVAESSPIIKRSRGTLSTLIETCTA
jgi:hypothetical protein